MRASCGCSRLLSAGTFKAFSTRTGSEHGVTCTLEHALMSNLSADALALNFGRKD
jgi:hypothetical protein